LGAFVKDGMDVVAAVVHGTDRYRFGPSLTTIPRLEQVMRPDAGVPRGEMRDRQVHRAVAIAADGASGPIAVLEIAWGRSDLLRGPDVAAIRRHRHHHRHV